MEEDFSKGSLAVILVLALIISVLSTFSVLNAIDKAPVAETEIQTSSLTSGQLKLSIEHEPIASSQSAAIMLSIQQGGN